MNYYGAKELAASYRTVRKNTVIIAEEIGEEHYSFRPTPSTRTVAETLLHVAVSPRWAHQVHAVDHLSDLANFDFMTFMGGLMMVEKTPHTKAQILGLLKEEDERFTSWLESFSDEFLAEKVAMREGMAAPKTRFEMLLGPKEHDMHHRGQ